MAESLLALPVLCAQHNSIVARDRLRFEHHLLNLNSRLSRTVNK